MLELTKVQVSHFVFTGSKYFSPLNGKRELIFKIWKVNGYYSIYQRVGAVGWQRVNQTNKLKLQHIQKLISKIKGKQRKWKAVALTKVGTRTNHSGFRSRIWLKRQQSKRKQNGKDEESMRFFLCLNDLVINIDY